MPVKRLNVSETLRFADMGPISAFYKRALAPAELTDARIGHKYVPGQDSGH
jgi:hypothetical protein